MNDVSVGVVIALGPSIVFIGLLVLVFIVWLMGAIAKCFIKEPAKPVQDVPTAPTPTPAPAPVAVSGPIENREALLAAISACIAEELGTDVSAISIQSFRRI